MRIVLEAGDEEWMTRVVANAIREALEGNAVQPGVEIMTLAEVASYTRVPANTLRYWRSVGIRGPRSHKRGRRVYYNRSDVDAWLTRGEQ